MSMRDHRKGRPPIRPPVTRSSGAASTSPSDFANGTAPPAPAPAPAPTPEPMAKTQPAPGLRLPYLDASDTESESPKGYPHVDRLTETDYPPSTGGADFAYGTAQADDDEHPLQQMAQAQAEAQYKQAVAESSERSQKGFSHVRGRPAMRPPSEMPEMLETVLGESQAALGPCHWEFIKGIWEVDLGDWEARAAAAVGPCGWEAQAAAAVGPCDAALAVAIGLARQALQDAQANSDIGKASKQLGEARKLLAVSSPSSAGAAGPLPSTRQTAKAYD